jgi:hypothetical protein
VDRIACGRTVDLLGQASERGQIIEPDQHFVLSRRQAARDVEVIGIEQNIAFTP